VKLEAIDLADATIDECPSCGGVWLDSGEYRAACRHRMERRLDRYAPSLRPRTTRLGRILDRLNERIDVALEALEQLDEEPGPTRPSFPRRTRRQ
jgi:Zn-finger nucleic acid-binding protein